MEPLNQKPNILDTVETLKGTLFNIEINASENSNEPKNPQEDISFYDRVMVISQIHSEWMKAMTVMNSNTNNTLTIAMRDIVESELSESYSWNSFVKDYNAVIRIMRRTKGQRIGSIEWECTGTECKIMDRQQRDRRFYGQNRAERDALYYIKRAHGDSKEEEVNEQDATLDIATQQILDTVHCLMFHSMSIKAEIHRLLNDEDQVADDENDLCRDTVIQKVLDLVDRERERTMRRRTNDGDQKHDKFMTSNSKEVQSETVSAVVSQTENAKNAENLKISKISNHRCFTDILVDELERGQFGKQQIESFCRSLREQRYDTDSMMEDIGEKVADDTNSNLIRWSKMQSEASKILCTVRRLCLEKRVRASMYSAGFRYFYWSFYKNNELEINQLSKRNREGNKGYKLKDWYIPKKYENLKDEALNNKIARFTLHQFDVTLCKAKEKLTAWNNDENARKLIAVRSTAMWWKPYGMKKDQPISVQHIQSLLFYTNFTEQCYHFGTTYRKMSELESDESLKERHGEVAIWGRLLRETVEIYGAHLPYIRPDLRFYHGVSEELYFESTSIKLCGPTSTTAGK